MDYRQLSLSASQLYQDSEKTNRKVGRKEKQKNQRKEDKKAFK